MRLSPSFIVPRPQTVPPPTVHLEASARETVICLHGTYANAVHKGKENSIDWWRPGSGFTKQLNTELEAAGSGARCWAHVSNEDPFAWSGANTEGARRDAGRALALELQRLEHHPHITRYHVVAHSHGGNVLLNALRELHDAPHKLGSVVFMGTPALWFHHRVALDTRWISLPMYLAAAIACGWAAHLASRDAEFYWGVATLVLVLSVGFELFFACGRSQRHEHELYGSGRPKAFVFGGDEAINGLITAQAIAKHPLRFIQKMAESKAPDPPAVPPRGAPKRGLMEQAEDSGIAAVLHLLAAPEPQLGTPNFGALASALAASHRPSAPARQGSVQVPPALITALRSFDNSFGGLKFSLLLQGVFWCLMLLPRLFIAVTLTLLTFVRRCGSVIGARIALAFATRLAAFALPRLVRKGAMGADEGRFVRVSNLPPGVERHESLDDDVALAALSVGRDLGGLAGSSLLGAIGNQDVFSVKRYIEEALSNAALAHSYYYKSPKIIAATAAAIAEGPRPSV